MNHIEGTFSAIRGASIYYQAWLPEGDPKAVILVVHSLGEHSGRYTNVVTALVPAGYAIYSLDHLGHGKSSGEREVIQRFSDYTDTLTTYCQTISSWQPGKPIFLLGHSMGGLIVSYYLLDNQAAFKGAVISAPAVKVGASITPVTIAMGKILSAIAPKAGILGLDAQMISRDPKVVEAYVNDPLVFHGKTPARLAAEMLKAMMRVSAEASTITLPILILQGSEDKLVDPGGAQMLYDLASSADKTLRIYEGLFHEVCNEPERFTVLAEVEAWLDARV